MDICLLHRVKIIHLCVRFYNKLEANHVIYHFFIYGILINIQHSHFLLFDLMWLFY